MRTKSWTQKGVGMYKKEEKEKALKLYEEVKSVKKIIQKLGYPTREGLYKWLRDSKNPPDKTKTPRRRINNSPEHPLHPPTEYEKPNPHTDRLT